MSLVLRYLAVADASLVNPVTPRVVSPPPRRMTVPGSGTTVSVVMRVSGPRTRSAFNAVTIFMFEAGRSDVVAIREKTGSPDDASTTSKPNVLPMRGLVIRNGIRNAMVALAWALVTRALSSAVAAAAAASARSARESESAATAGEAVHSRAAVHSPITVRMDTHGNPRATGNGAAGGASPCEPPGIDRKTDGNASHGR